ncbi:MAG: DCC1-like thiol-disulfide oxidoreductase family protein [Cyanobium sp.]
MGVHSLEQRATAAEASDPGEAPILVFDGDCPFCRHFAELSELRSGIPGLVIRDGRGDRELRQALARRGYHLRDGAMVIEGDRVWHGAAAISWLCARMEPSAALLGVLAPLMAQTSRAERLYPLLLLARRLALGMRGWPVDPDEQYPGLCSSDQGNPSRHPQLR